MFYEKLKKIKNKFKGNNITQKDFSDYVEEPSETLDGLNPSEYFHRLKEKQTHMDDELLNQIYDNCIQLANKYIVTGQQKALQKMMFHLNCIEKERELVKMGLNTFVYRDDIEDYIDNVAKDVVKIIELENYDREIPDDIAYSVAEIRQKHLLNKLYVVFTDYTGKVEKQVAKERRDKDPILFGSLYDPENNIALERFYYIGDWEDEFCDLTLDRMVSEMKKKTGKNIAVTFKTPEDIQEQLDQLALMEPMGNKFKVRR